MRFKFRLQNINCCRPCVVFGQKMLSFRGSLGKLDKILTLQNFNFVKVELFDRNNITRFNEINKIIFVFEK